MAKRAVKWTRTADIQYVGILEYWVKRNKSVTYSKKLIKTVAKRTKQIADTPFIYKKTDFKDVRVASLGKFIYSTLIQSYYQKFFRAFGGSKLFRITLSSYESEIVFLL